MLVVVLLVMVLRTRNGHHPLPTSSISLAAAVVDVVIVGRGGRLALLVRLAKRGPRGPA